MRKCSKNMIRFQTPLTKIHVDFASGMVIFNIAEEALRKCGFTVRPMTIRNSKDITVETINSLFPMSTVGEPLVWNLSGLLESAQEKLREF